MKKIDEALLEEMSERGPGTRLELERRLAGRLQDALDRLVGDKQIHKHDSPLHGREKFYSFSLEPPRASPTATAPMKRRV